jgi:hypothetical protein
MRPSTAHFSIRSIVQQLLGQDLADAFAASVRYAMLRSQRCDTAWNDARILFPPPR